MACVWRREEGVAEAARGEGVYIVLERWAEEEPVGDDVQVPVMFPMLLLPARQSSVRDRSGEIEREAAAGESLRYRRVSLNTGRSYSRSNRAAGVAMNHAITRAGRDDGRASVGKKRWKEKKKGGPCHSAVSNCRAEDGLGAACQCKTCMPFSASISPPAGHCRVRVFLPLMCLAWTRLGGSTRSSLKSNDHAPSEERRRARPQGASLNVMASERG